MHRGEIWWATLPQPIGRRPVLLLSRNQVYKVRASATVAPVTRTMRGIQAEVRIGPDDGLPQESVVNLDNIQTIDKTAIETFIAELGPLKMAEVDRAIKYALAIP